MTSAVLLSSRTTLQELAAAFARPMVRALAAGGRDLAVMRTVARAGIDPPPGWERLTGKFEQSRRDVLRVLSARLPGVDEQVLVFRTRCAAGLSLLPEARAIQHSRDSGDDPR
jgi:hypothetical protein